MPRTMIEPFRIEPVQPSHTAARGEGRHLREEVRQARSREVRRARFTRKAALLRHLAAELRRA